MKIFAIACVFAACGPETKPIPVAQPVPVTVQTANLVKDRDGDGLADDADACPTIFASTSDGCPKKRQRAEGAADRDGDGIADDMDKCPDDPEDRDGFQDEDGCPDPDNDKDGILDVSDQCPSAPETMNGYRDEDGCPDKLP
jgi:large repetitive protein